MSVSVNYELFALAAATCWAVGSLMSAKASTHLGAFTFTRWRMLCASVMLWTIALFSGGWHSLAVDSIWILLLTGVIGIFIGDTALFASMNRLGPRRAGVLFATHSVFSVILAYFVFGEILLGWTLIGCGLLIAGVMIAILFGKRKAELHDWESTPANWKSGVALGLLSALCQAVATLMLKPVMQEGVDPVAASAVRMTTAFVLHQILFVVGVRAAKAYLPMNRRVFLLTAGNAALSMVLGMTLILQALRYGDVGLVAMLSSVSPVIVLPLLWLAYKRAPGWGAWAGAALTVIGTTLILIH